MHQGVTPEGSGGGLQPRAELSGGWRLSFREGVMGQAAACKAGFASPGLEGRRQAAIAPQSACQGFLYWVSGRKGPLGHRKDRQGLNKLTPAHKAQVVALCFSSVRVISAEAGLEQERGELFLLPQAGSGLPSCSAKGQGGSSVTRRCRQGSCPHFWALLALLPAGGLHVEEALQEVELQDPGEDDDTALSH